MMPLAQGLLYLDPGTGSYLIQMLIAALAGGLLAVGIYWRKVKSWLRKIFKKGGDIEGEDLQDDDDEE